MTHMNELLHVQLTQLANITYTLGCKENTEVSQAELDYTANKYNEKLIEIQKYISTAYTPRVHIPRDAITTEITVV